MRILTISGSLRAASSNTILLESVAALAPSGVEMIKCDAIGALPFFNPDLDGETPPPEVVDFRAQLQGADAVIFSTPEYAHGVPGVLKNALDWTVSSGVLFRKPVALINTSPIARLAQESLMETLRTMENQIVGGKPFVVPLARNSVDLAGMLANPQVSEALRAVVAALAEAVQSGYS